MDGRTGFYDWQDAYMSAEYIQGWLEVLRNDKRMIVQASGKAAKAVDFILYRPAPAYR